MNKIKGNLSTIITFIVCAITLLYNWDRVGFLWAVIFTFVIGFITQLILNKLLSNNKKATHVPRLTREKEKFYLSKGLSNEDITFFRETMMTTKEYIQSIEKRMVESSKLSAIEKRNNTIEISKALFNDIVKEPHRLHQVDQFLYIHLPSLNDLVKKYSDIENHKAKSRTTYDILNKSAVTIDELCEQITNDYLSFKDSDLSSLDSSVDVTKKTIKQSLNSNDI